MADTEWAPPTRDKTPRHQMQQATLLSTVVTINSATVWSCRLTEAAQSHGKLKEQYWELWEKHDLVYNHAEGLLPEHELLNLLAKQEEGADEAATQVHWLRSNSIVARSV